MTDEEKPTEEQPDRPEGPAAADDEQPTREVPRRRLTRSRSDRVIAGVSGGLGRHFDVDPLIFRISFVVTLFFGGLGVLAYLAAWLVVPMDEGDGEASRSPRLEGVGRIVGVLFLALLLLCVFSGLFVAGAFLTGIGWGLAVIALIALIGAGLVAVSFTGGSRWLILPALALALGAASAAALDIDLEGGIGEREYRPDSPAAIPEDGYEVGLGRLAIDLRAIDWRPGQIVPVEASVGAGQAVIAVPTGVCVVADAHARAGELRIAGQESSGWDVDSTVGAGSRATPRVEIDADVDAGQIQVVNDDSVDITDGRDWDDGYWHGNPSEMRDANERACAG